MSNIYENNNMFKKILDKKLKENRYNSLVFLCIGTDKVSGDSYGPIVGTKLKNKLELKNISNIKVYGNLDKNINYINVLEEVKNIYANNKNPCIICIDSALSNKENIGKVFIKEGKTFLGSSLNKTKIEIGDISIKGVVGENSNISKYNFEVLQNVSTRDITNLANKTVDSIFDVLYERMYN